MNLAAAENAQMSSVQGFCATLYLQEAADELFLPILLQKIQQKVVYRQSYTSTARSIDRLLFGEDMHVPMRIQTLARHEPYRAPLSIDCFSHTRALLAQPATLAAGSAKIVSSKIPQSPYSIIATPSCVIAPGSSAIFGHEKQVQ